MNLPYSQHHRSHMFSGLPGDVTRRPSFLPMSGKFVLEIQHGSLECSCVHILWMRRNVVNLRLYSYIEESSRKFPATGYAPEMGARFWFQMCCTAVQNVRENSADRKDDFVSKNTFG